MFSRFMYEGRRLVEAHSGRRSVSQSEQLTKHCSLLSVCENEEVTWTFFQDPSYLYDVTNETAGRFVPAQILYDAFYGRYQSGTGAIILLVVIWGSFFFAGLSITTSAARVVSKYLPL